MRRQPSLRSQLNQIRMWVRQGRTDAWIAHKLDISVDELARFKREHTLDDSDEGTRARPADPLSVPAPEPRWEVFEEDEEEEEEEEQEQEREQEVRAEREPARSRRSRRSRTRRTTRALDEDEEPAEEYERSPAAGLDDEGDTDREPDGDAPRRRRRGRRGGRRHRGRRNAFEATFDHGGEGYGLWLDPAVADNPVYSEHWAGHRAVTVTVEPEAITIRRASGAAGPSPDSGPDQAEPEDA